MKKKIQIICLGFVTLTLQLITHHSFSQNVGINSDGSNADSNTMLEIKSTDNTSSSFGLKVKDSGGNATMVVRSDGNVGIGTTSPGEALHVVPTNNMGGIEISGSPSNISLQMNNTGTGGLMWRIVNASSGSAYPAGTFNIDRNDNVARMTFLDNGNTGIGTTAPKNRLDVEGGLVVGTSYSGTETAPSNGIGVQGSIGVGTVTPGAQIDLSGNFQGTNPGENLKLQFSKDNIPLFGFRIASSNSVFNLDYRDFGATWHAGISIHRNSGNVGIGCTGPQYPLHVAGDIAAEGGVLRASSAAINTTITTCSDIRYKKDIKRLSNSLENIMALKGVNYHWKKDEFPDKHFTSEKQIGVIAQEVEKLYPELVATDDKGYKSVDYSRFTPILIEAIKEQQELIESLTKHNRYQEEKVDNLSSSVSILTVENNKLRAEMKKQNNAMETRIIQLEELIKTANK